MVTVEQLRKRQEQRLAPALESWNEAKAELAKAIALAEAREREFREVSDDVQRKLEALDLVIGMANEVGEVPRASDDKTRLLQPKAADAAETAIQIRQDEPRTRGLTGLLRATSRPLFPSHQRSRNSIVSNLREL